MSKNGVDMPGVSLASLLASSTVVWLLGISYDQPKEIRNISPQVICNEDYDYGYKSCADLLHYVTPTIPGETSSQPDFIGEHPFAYKFIYGKSVNMTDNYRMAMAKKLYEKLNCKGHYQNYEKQYETLEQKHLVNFLQKDVMPRIAKENADQAIDAKRKKYCLNVATKQQQRRYLRQDMKSEHVRKR